MAHQWCWVYFWPLALPDQASAQWRDYLRYFYQVDFGTADPIFSKDISFYLFKLPVFEFLQGWLISLLFMTLIGVAAIYAINLSARYSTRPMAAVPTTGIAAACGARGRFAGWAFGQLGYWLDIYQSALFATRRGVWGQLHGYECLYLGVASTNAVYRPGGAGRCF